MRDGQIERLLGGYATNTLTESERQALFEAALDDQELFDALQDEQALRELLEDSGARRMIERAAKETRPGPVRGWLARPRLAHAWAWGLAGCAAAAGLLVFMLGPFGQATRTSGEVALLKAPGPIETAAPPAPSGTAVPAPKVLEQYSAPVRGKAAKKSTGLERHEAEVAQSYAPSPAVASPAATAGGSPAAPPPAPEAVAQAPARITSLGGGDQAQDKLKHVPPIPYSVVRRSPDGSFAALSQGEELQAGDSVRVAVRPPMPGSLTLFERSAEGNWNSIQALQVTAGREYTVPSSPIQVNGETRLRLVMMTGEGAGPSDLREAAKEALSRPKQRLGTESATASPVTAAQVPQRTLTTDITLMPGKAVGR